MLSILPLSQLTDERRREAASLLFAHLSVAERSERIEQFLTAIAKSELNPATILTAWFHDCIVGIQVVEILPGRSAALWAIRSRPGSERPNFEDALLTSAAELLRSSGVKIAQCLLASDEHTAAEALRRQGLRRLTSVQHLRAQCTANNSQADTQTESLASIRFHLFDACDPNIVQQALVQSFEDTLDFPEMNDLRTTDEIMAGHRTSAPHLDRWWMLRHDEEPAGVLILADGAMPDFWDLAYLGVIPKMRRNGIGRAAVAFALRQTQLAGKAGLTLMVDERNQPALELYAKAGFECVAMRDVYLWVSTR